MDRNVLNAASQQRTPPLPWTLVYSCTGRMSLLQRGLFICCIPVPIREVPLYIIVYLSLFATTHDTWDNIQSVDTSVQGQRLGTHLYRQDNNVWLFVCLTGLVVICHKNFERDSSQRSCGYKYKSSALVIQLCRSCFWGQIVWLHAEFYFNCKS